MRIPETTTVALLFVAAEKNKLSTRCAECLGTHV